MDSLKISTITLSTQLPDCKINLINVGKYLKLNDSIIGIKYQHGNFNILKGKYSTTVFRKAKNKKQEKISQILFYNQVSLIINLSFNSNINVKLFGNGSLHLTGCKSVNDGVEVTKIIYNILKQYDNTKDIVFLCKDENGVLLDSNNFIYTYDSKQIIGYKNNKINNSYIIQKKEYEIDHHTGMFISKRLETQRRKTIINFNNQVIGYSKIELFKNKSKFYKNNAHIYYDKINNLIYYKNDTIIGKILYDFNEKSITKLDSLPDFFEYKYNCTMFEKEYLLKDYSLINVDINCINVYFNLNMEINRLKLYKLLISLDYICKYHPESYSGVKLLYKLPICSNESDGHCKCSNKCTCTNITFLIFQSGNVIVTGFKNENYIKDIIKNFVTLCYENSSLIKTNKQEIIMY